MRTQHVLTFALSIAVVSPIPSHAQNYKDAASVMEKIADSSGYISSDRDRPDLRSTMSALADRASTVAEKLSGLGNKLIDDSKDRLCGSAQSLKRAAETVRDGAKSLADKLGGGDDIRSDTEVIRRQVAELISDWKEFAEDIRRTHAELIAEKDESSTRSLANLRTMFELRNREDAAEQRCNAARAAAEAARPRLVQLQGQLQALDVQINQVSAIAIGTNGTAQERIAAAEAWMTLSAQRANLSENEEQAREAQAALDNAHYQAAAEHAAAHRACVEAMGGRPLTETIRLNELALGRLNFFRSEFGD